MRVERARTALVGAALALVLAAPAVADPDPLRTAASLRDGLTQMLDGAIVETELNEAAAWFDDALAQGSDPGEAVMNARIVLPGLRIAIDGLAERAAAFDAEVVPAPPLYPLTEETVQRGLRDAPGFLRRLADLLEAQAAHANDAEMLLGGRNAWMSTLDHRQTDWRLLARVERDALPADHPEHLLQVHAIELFDLNATLLSVWTRPADDTRDPLPALDAALARYQRRAGPALDAALSTLPAYEAALSATLAGPLGAEAGPRAAAAARAYATLVDALRETSEIIQAYAPLVVRGVLDPDDRGLGRELSALHARTIANHRRVMTRWIAVYDAILTPTPEIEESR